MTEEQILQIIPELKGLSEIQARYVKRLLEYAHHDYADKGYYADQADVTPELMGEVFESLPDFSKDWYR